MERKRKGVDIGPSGKPSGTGARQPSTAVRTVAAEIGIRIGLENN